MRQQTTNTFDKGLNKDLNPIVTPNDVLTDCLNGTFITFNGDELTLQNDAGNTTIPIPDYSKEYDPKIIYKKGDEVHVIEDNSYYYYRSLRDDNSANTMDDRYWKQYFPNVTLTEGFHPLGMKEYGGVLYIASGKYGNIGTMGSNGVIIKRGDSNAIEDVIEFGSYPSPMFAKPTYRRGLMNLENFEAKDLYKSIIINDLYFRSGGYVTFDGIDPTVPHDTPLNALWTPTNPKGFYKVRLMHQFDTGVFELTDLIWKKYLEYRKGKEDVEPEHWINSSNFKYFCPNRYKGKLAIIIELNEPSHFELLMPPKTTFEETKFKLDIYIDMDERGGDEESLIHFLGYKVNLVYNDEVEESYTVWNPSTEEPNPTKHFFIPNDKKHASYTITPVTNYEWENLPVEFKDKFTLRGNIFLEDRYLELYFDKKEGLCMTEESKKGYREYNVLLLGDGTNFLGLESLGEDSFQFKKIAEKDLYTEIGKPVAFYRQGAESFSWDNKYLKKGEFTVDGAGKITLTQDGSYTTFKESLHEDSQKTLDFFEQQTYFTIVEDSTCDTLYMRIIFEEEPGRVKFFWKSNPLIEVQATKKGLVYEVAIPDARDTLEVHAFAIKRSFLVLLDYETREPMETEYIFRKPAPRILVISDPANPNAPTCRLSSKAGFAEFNPMHWMFTYPNGTSTSLGQVRVTMTFTLHLTMGTILKPSQYDLSAVFRSWNINSKNVSYVERKVGEGVYMDYTITVNLAKAYPTPGGGGGGGGGGGTVPIEAIRSTSPGGIVPMMTPWPEDRIEGETEVFGSITLTATSSYAGSTTENKFTFTVSNLITQY